MFEVGDYLQVVWTRWEFNIGFEDTHEISGDDVCWCVVFGTRVGVSVFIVMWLELLIMLDINVNLCISVHEYQIVLLNQIGSYVSVCWRVFRTCVDAGEYV